MVVCSSTESQVYSRVIRCGSSSSSSSIRSINNTDTVIEREREFMMCALKMEDESVFCETFSKSSLETRNVSSTVLPGTNNNKNNSNNVSSSSSTSKE